VEHFSPKGSPMKITIKPTEKLTEITPLEADHFGEAGPALLWYQDFKEQVIANFLSNHWELTSEEIETALDRIRVLRSRSKAEAAWHSST
jgi:hypothetical protein